MCGQAWRAAHLGPEARGEPACCGDGCGEMLWHAHKDVACNMRDMRIHSTNMMMRPVRAPRQWLSA